MTSSPTTRRPQVALAGLLAFALFATPPAPAVAKPSVTGLPDFVELAERLSPAVVNISTSTARRESGEQEFFEPFERFFGGPMPRRPRRQRSLGSGFVIGKQGLVVTNNHVIEDADEIVVKLSDGREKKAELLGRDKKTDIALLKIVDLDGEELTALELGDSDDLKVGEWVFAIGNPFGLENTVTAGIVSAKGRRIGGPYDDFIQTDASINPGNSGGPLIDLSGRAVGINTAIFSRTGGNIGIGFAIPMNLAKGLLPQLEEKGRVTRGWLGVLIQKMTPEIAESLGIEEARGALVADVMDPSPAKEAEIKVGDVIVEFDGAPVEDSSDLPLLVARTPVGRAVDVVVIRAGERVVLQVAIGELEDDEIAATASEETEALGLTVQNLTPEISESLELEPSTKGVVVSGVEPGSPADDARIRRGDVILEVNRKAVKNAEGFLEEVRKVEDKKSVLLLVRRGENTIFLALKKN